MKTIKAMHTPSQVARQLKVSIRSIHRACKRWTIGTKFKVGSTGKMYYLLTDEDVAYLNKHLQRKAGRPFNANNKSDSNPRQKITARHENRIR